MSNFLGDFPSPWITHLFLWENALGWRKSLASCRGEERACNLKCWVAISLSLGLSPDWWMVPLWHASDVKNLPQVPVQACFAQVHTGTLGGTVVLKDRRRARALRKREFMEKAGTWGKQEAWRGREKRMCIPIQCPSSSGEHFPFQIWACIGNPVTDANYIWLFQIKAGHVLEASSWLGVLGVYPSNRNLASLLSLFLSHVSSFPLHHSHTLSS